MQGFHSFFFSQYLSPVQVLPCSQFSVFRHSSFQFYKCRARPKVVQLWEFYHRLFHKWLNFFRTKDNSLPAQNESFSEGTFIDNFRFHFNFYNKRANTYWLSSLYAAVQSVYHLTSPEGQDAPVFPDITTGDLPTCLFFLITSFITFSKSCFLHFSY